MAREEEDRKSLVSLAKSSWRSRCWRGGREGEGARSPPETLSSPTLSFFFFNFNFFFYLGWIVVEGVGADIFLTRRCFRGMICTYICLQFSSVNGLRERRQVFYV